MTKKHLIWTDCQQRFSTNNIQKGQSKIGRKIVKKTLSETAGTGCSQCCSETISQSIFKKRNASKVYVKTRLPHLAY